MRSELDVAALAAPQRRVVEELLAIGRARPPADTRAAARVQRLVDAGTAAVAAGRPPGARGLALSKSALATLGCDGRYLDHRATRFAWSRRTAAGTLAHRAIQLDQAGRRVHDVHTVTLQAWRDFRSSDRAADAFAAALNAVEQDAIRAEAADRVTAFRECVPLLPPRWNVRFEAPLRSLLHDGAILLLGRPDLLLGAPHPTERRMLLVDLKTGARSARHRDDMRFYALLCTLKYGTPPFRVATYYLDEADWDAEDVDDDALEAAARTVVAAAVRTARLEWTAPAEADLQLTPGPACGWCTRAPTCRAVPRDQAVRPLHAPSRAA